MLLATEHNSYSTASSSSGSSSSRQSSGAGEYMAVAGQSDFRQPRHRVCATHKSLSAYFVELSEGDFFPRPRPPGSDSQAQALRSIWQKHSAELCTVLEQTLRLQAAVPAMSRACYWQCIASMCCRRLTGPLGVLVYAFEQQVKEQQLQQQQQQQQQLSSLLFSLLKFARLQAAASPDAADCCHLAAATTAAVLLEMATPPVQQPVVDGVQEHDTHNSSATAASSSSDGPSSSLSMLPWLVLVGRCCLYWADHFWQLFVLKDAPAPAGSSTQAAVLKSTPACTRLAFQGCESSRDIFFKSDPFKLGRTKSIFIISILNAFLNYMDDNRAALTAAGYDTTAWEQQMELLLRAVHAAQPAEGSNKPDADAARSLVQQLKSIGLTLTSLAISSACNNAACSNMATPSELALVKGPGRTCAGCRTARYCSKACQTQSWKQHKPVCKALVAAAAKAAAATSAPA